MWNVDFLSVFPNVNVNDLNKLEKYFLELVRYNVSLKASEYGAIPPPPNLPCGIHKTDPFIARMAMI